MSSYNGPAVLITNEGREHPVTANLHTTSHGLRTGWAGTLSVPANQQPAELMNLSRGRLRLQDEREGEFLRPDIGDWLGSPPQSFQITIVGSGDEPF
ncbi:hypothetical protein [Streptomyces sp. H27-S2]|uniref:hypothetical protein n=1 Tax=Streptomyces antarcticus TaxID=2996458 RepID=UPI00226DE45E|nr:hypothetical protein [Streptomyces sp. H27-S2]MCY0952096.1 hypothetical protein [Streptomyces sp. H27-S2]